MVHIGHIITHMTTYGEAFNAAVAAELRAERARTGVTLAELVEGSGIAQSSVQRYLGGKRDIPLTALYDMCTVLGIDPRVIFERAQDSVK